MSKNPIDKLSGFVVVTGASSGIGLELAKLAAKDGCEVLIVADRETEQAQQTLRETGAASIERLEADLGTPQGIEALLQKIGDREVAALIANAGTSQGGTFLDHDWDQIVHTINTNIVGTLALVHAIGRAMRARDRGRILVTGSIVGGMPGPYNLIYNSTKSFINDFCVALANELEDTRLVISCLLPGATETKFFERANMDDTPIGQAPKADPAKVAEDGYDALLKGEIQEVSGLLNALQSKFADILPKELVSTLHEAIAKPRDKA